MKISIASPMINITDALIKYEQLTFLLISHTLLKEGLMKMPIKFELTIVAQTVV